LQSTVLVHESLFLSPLQQSLVFICAKWKLKLWSWHCKCCSCTHSTGTYSLRRLQCRVIVFL